MNFLPISVGKRVSLSFSDPKIENSKITGQCKKRKLLTYFDEVLARRAGSSRYAARLPSQTRRLAALNRRFLLPERSNLFQDLPLRSSGILELVTPGEDGTTAHHRCVRRPRQAEDKSGRRVK